MANERVSQTAPGVEIHRGRVRLTFYLAGRRYRETLPGPASATNIRHANRLAEEIRRRIAIGAFDYAAMFPDSPRATIGGKQAPSTTFREFGERWFAAHSAGIAKSTAKSYGVALRSFWFAALGDKRLDRITYLDVAEALAGRAWASQKTRNNYLIPARKVFDAAIVEGLIERDPTTRVRNVKAEKPEPDPLTAEEMGRVLDYMANRYPPGVGLYFRFAFASGLRTSELIELRWGDVDFVRGVARISRARVENEAKATKTTRVRYIDLTPSAIEALNAAKAISFLKGPGAVVFENPVTRKQWVDDKSQREAYWLPTLRALGLRDRAAYQTRHTFATLLLMAGVNPAYIAAQLGHATTKMLFEHYSRWIPGADSGAEAAKAAAIFAPKAPPGVPALPAKARG